MNFNDDANTLKTTSFMNYRQRIFVVSIFILIQVPLIFLVHGQTIEIGTSPNPVGSGARALGQGNAFIAVADDATAASWNPAGLSQLEKSEISFAFEHSFRREEINSSRHPESTSNETITFENLNYASAAFPLFFLNRNMVVSLNYLRLYGFDKEMEFPINTSNRQSLFRFRQDGEFSVVAPALGIDVTNKLSLGISVNIWNQSITQSSSYEQKSNSIGTLISNSGLSGQFENSITDEFEVEDGYSFVVGGMVRVTKKWNIGGVVKPSYRLELDHRNTFSFFQTGQVGNIPPIFDINDTNAELRFPWIIGGGVAFRPNDPLTISADVTWTQWSEYVFEEGNESTNPLTGTETRVDELNDTFTVRLGGEYLLLINRYVVPLRLGFGYDPAPAVENVNDFFTVNIGSGVQMYDRINFDIGYEFRWGNNVNEDILRGIAGSQDIRSHRVLASMIIYF